MTETLGLVARFVEYAGILGIVGAVSFRLLVLKRVPVNPGSALRASRRAARIGAVAALLVLLSAVGRLALQTDEMRFPTDSWFAVGFNMLWHTSWGTAWMVQVACALLLTMSYSLARKDALPRWSTIALLSVVLAATPAYASHAMSAQRFTQFTFAADVLHVLAASVWIGTLFVMTMSVTRGDSSEPDSSQSTTELRQRYLALLLHGFSPLAQASVAVVVLSGVLSSVAHIEHWADVIGTPYGTALYRKLVFVLVVLVLGWRNWKFVTPRLDADGPRRMVRGMVGELLIAVVVLALTSALVVTPPPGEMGP